MGVSTGIMMKTVSEVSGMGEGRHGVKRGMHVINSSVFCVCKCFLKFSNVLNRNSVWQ